MEENPFIFQEKVKNAFSRIKEENLIVKNDIVSLKEEISTIKTEISSINHKIGEIMDILLKIADKKGFPQEMISTGNEGVFQHSPNTPPTLPQQPNSKHIEIPKEMVEKMKDEVDDQYRSLTDKQFLVFTTIYHLQEELNRPISYKELAQKLKISSSSIRGHVGELILKRVPINKFKSSDGNILVAIPESLKSLKMLGKLDRLRRFDFNQRTLFDD